MTRTWTEVADGVRVCQARLYTTSSTVIEADGRALLVDPALEPSELVRAGRGPRLAGLRVAAGVATHAHYDHLLWHPDFGDAPRWASGTAAAAVPSTARNCSNSSVRCRTG